MRNLWVFFYGLPLPSCISIEASTGYSLKSIAIRNLVLMAQQITLDTLESWLRESTSILRGSIDSWDFKNYIFGVLFVMRFNDLFEERVRQQEQDENLSEKYAAVEVQAKWGIFPSSAGWPNLIARTEILAVVDEKRGSLLAKHRHYQTVQRDLMQKLLAGEWRVRVDAEIAA